MVKLTKTELRSQQVRLAQLMKYLPTLQLKKMLLQIEVNSAEAEVEHLTSEFNGMEEKIAKYSQLFSDKQAADLFPSVKILEVQTKHENIAGVDIPIFEKVVFQESTYFFFDTPVWLDAGVGGLRDLITVREKIRVVEEKKAALEKELREVSIRVNLFEKILIPRAEDNIKKIKIFLGDLQLAAVCQAKVSKKKIEKRS